jgi:hypothetical protein
MTGVSETLGGALVVAANATVGGAAALATRGLSAIGALCRQPPEWSSLPAASTEPRLFVIIYPLLQLLHNFA